MPRQNREAARICAASVIGSNLCDCFLLSSCSRSRCRLYRRRGRRDSQWGRRSCRWPWCQRGSRRGRRFGSRCGRRPGCRRGPGCRCGRSGCRSVRRSGGGCRRVRKSGSGRYLGQGRGRLRLVDGAVPKAVRHRVVVVCLSYLRANGIACLVPIAPGIRSIGIGRIPEAADIVLIEAHGSRLAEGACAARIAVTWRRNGGRCASPGGKRVLFGADRRVRVRDPRRL